MQLIVNGETHEHYGDGHFASLVQELGAEPGRVATMLNDMVVPAEDRAVTTLRGGDRIELLVFAAGG